MRGLAFLAAAILAIAPTADASPCDTLAAYARKVRPAEWDFKSKALEPVLHLPGDSKGKNIPPFERRLAEADWVQDATAFNVFTQHITGTNLYLAYSVQGTMYCQSSVFARKGSHGVPDRLPNPPGQGDDGVSPCWSRSGSLATVAGVPAFVIHGTTSFYDPTERLEVAPWTGGRWGKACAVEIRFKIDFPITERICQDEAVCAAAEPLARDIAFAYHRFRAQNKSGDFLYLVPPREEEGVISDWRSRYKSELTFPPTKTLVGGGSFGGAYHLFPLKLNGKLYLAEIGHEGLGWRENENTLLAVYDPGVTVHVDHPGTEFVGYEPRVLAAFVLPVKAVGFESATVQRPTILVDRKPVLRP